MSRKTIVRQLQSRSFAILLIVLSISIAIVCPLSSPVASEEYYGIIFHGNSHISSYFLNFSINVAILLLSALVLVFINRHFKLVRSNTWYFVGLFFVLQLSLPGLVDMFQWGSTISLMSVLITALLFNTYSSTRSSRTVFMMTIIVVTGSLWIVPLLYLIPIICIGMFQMRILDGRTITAFILGLITPFWIIKGFEIAPLSIPVLPSDEFSLMDIIRQSKPSVMMTYLCLILASVISLFAVLVKAFGYNARKRALNGFMLLLNVVVMILFLLNIGGSYMYLPLLNLLTAFNIAHSFSLRANSTGVFPFLALPMIFIALRIWNFL